MDVLSAIDLPQLAPFSLVPCQVMLEDSHCELLSIALSSTSVIGLSLSVRRDLFKLIALVTV